MQRNKLPQDYFDIIIIDEAHHFAAISFSKVNELFKPKLLLGLSATPERTDGKDVYSFFGGESNVLGKLDLAWALKNNHLAKPKYHILTDDIDPSKLTAIRNGLTKSELDRTLFLHKKDEEIASIILKQVTLADIKTPKCIVFCRNIRHINNFFNHLPAGSATVVHSKMDRDAQRRSISDFREGSAKFILTVDIFNEGVDIPEVNALVFLRSTASKVIWMQQLGRGLRKTVNKNFVEVFDFVGSVNRIIEIESLKNEVRNAANERPQSDDLAEVTHQEDEVIHNMDLSVKYSKYAAEVQALLEQYNFKINSKQDCVNELIRIKEDIGKIPSPIEIAEEISTVSVDQIVTIFNDYWSAISSVYEASEIEEVRLELINVITSAGIEFYSIYHSVPSALLLQIETSQFEMPIVSAAFIQDVLDSIKFVKSNMIAEIKPRTDITAIETLPLNSKQILTSKYLKTIFNQKDLNSISADERKNIRMHFSLDSDFLKNLDLERSKEKN